MAVLSVAAHHALRRPDPIRVVEDQLAKNRWMLGAEFSLVDCAYYPIFNVIEKAGFSLAESLG